MSELYVVGTQVADGYPDGRYICSKNHGGVYNSFRVIAVLDYPSVRSVANDEAFSGAKCKEYDGLIYEPPWENRPEVPVWEGKRPEDSEDGYRESVLAALHREWCKYNAKGDKEAMNRCEELSRKYA